MTSCSQPPPQPPPVQVEEPAAPEAAIPDQTRAADLGPQLGWASFEPSGDVFGSPDVRPSFFSQRTGLLEVSLASGEGAEVYVLAAGRFYAGETPPDFDFEKYFVGRTPVAVPLHSGNRILVRGSNVDWVFSIDHTDGAWQLADTRASVKLTCFSGFTLASAQAFASFVEQNSATNAGATIVLALPDLPTQSITRTSGDCRFGMQSMMALMAAPYMGLSVAGSDALDLRMQNSESTEPQGVMSAPGPAAAAHDPRLSVESNVAADVIWDNSVVGRAPGTITLPGGTRSYWMILASPGHFQYTLRVPQEQMQQARYGVERVRAQLVPTQAAAP